MNPVLIFNIAEIFTDLKKLEQIAKILHRTKRKIYKEFVNSPARFAQRLGSMTRRQRKKFSLLVEDAQSQSAEMQHLSSSWIKKGAWKPVGGSSTGDLTIWTKTGKVAYTYPGVSYRVWEAMKGAKGTNGSGAGTVFWALYLRAFKKSSFGKFLKKVQKLSGIKGFK